MYSSQVIKERISMNKLAFLAVFVIPLSGCFGAGTWVKPNVPEHQQDAAWEQDKDFCTRQALSRVGPRPTAAPSAPQQPQAPTYNIQYKNQYGVPTGSATATPVNPGPGWGSNALGVANMTSLMVWDGQFGKLQRQCIAEKGWNKIPS